MRGSRVGAQLPLELILISAEYLTPVDLLSLLRASPGLARALTFQHTTLQDGEKRTILHLFAREGEAELMKLLLANHGIKPDSKDNCGRTPLSYAADGHEAVVRLLLDRQDVEADSRNNC